MRRLVAPDVLVSIALALVLSSCAQETLRPDAIKGESIELGEGSLYTWTQVDEEGNPAAVGVTFAAGMLTSLPSIPSRIPLNLPEDVGTSLFSHVGFEWNPQGHPPTGIYGDPHFDFHFYVIPEQQRLAIGTELDREQVDPLFVPENYIQDGDSGIGRTVYQMGVHWQDADAPEWNRQGFTKTLLYGFHRGDLVFIEPMITQAYLETKPDFQEDLKLPQSYQVSGFYPTSYSVRYDEASKSFTVALENFVER